MNIFTQESLKLMIHFFYPSIWSLDIPYIENKVNFSLTSTETSQKTLQNQSLMKMKLNSRLINVVFFVAQCYIFSCEFYIIYLGPIENGMYADWYVTLSLENLEGSYS